MCDYIRVRNWEKFQRFKNRRPPWIRLYREILDDAEIMTLPPDDFRFLIFCWLLASEDKTKTGLLPPIAKIPFRVRESRGWVEEKIKSLVDSKFLEICDHDEINMGSTRDQDGCPDNSDNSDDPDSSEDSEIYSRLPFSENPKPEEKQPAPPKQKTPKQDISPIAEEISESWNAMAETANKAGYRIPKIADWNDARLSHLSARLKSEFWRNNWKSAIELIPRTPFLRGQNQSQWIANISWFLRPDAVPKTMEQAFGPITAEIEPLEDIF